MTNQRRNERSEAKSWLRQRGTAPRIAALTALAAATALVAHAHGGTAKPAPLPPQPTAGAIEAVFVLDTTGSMSGLIEGAKQKIWTIANEMANARNTPEIRMGLIGYRDRGDAYVTQRFDLSPDVDALYANLQGFAAGGGGDTPESVNQALHEAVTQMSWSDRPGVYRVVFLVGDAPPHMDYDQDVPYETSVRLAAKRGIVINTVQCGNHGATAAVWQSIAYQAQGSYATIAQDGGMLAVRTPVDDELAKLNQKLAATVMAYGSGDEQREILDKLERAAAAPAPAAASRLSYMAKKGGALNSGRRDLVDAVEDGDVALEAVPERELPAELRGKDRAAQRALVASKADERKRLKGRIAELVQQRDRHLAEERERRAEAGEADAFDDKVLGAVRSQAAKVGIAY